MSNQHEGYLSVPKSPSRSGYNSLQNDAASTHSSEYTARPVRSEIEHRQHLSEDLEKLCLNEEYSDVTFIVEDQKLHAHKVILASRSEYFRALLYGGMKESNQAEIELDAPLDAFKALLNYIYTGTLIVYGMKQDTVLDVLGLAHVYNFVELEHAISSHLRRTLNLFNVCAVLDSAKLYHLNSLVRVCHRFMERHAAQILKRESFMTLSQSALKELLARDSFCAPEVDIFHAVCNWIKANPQYGACEGSDSPLSSVRLILLSVSELLTVVRPVGMMSADALLDAISERTKTGYNYLPHRGRLLPATNVASSQYGATVIAGELREALLSGDTIAYDMDRGYTRHTIGEPSSSGSQDPGGIIVQLGSNFIINHIRLLLWDRDPRSYSYYIELSMDQKEWIRVIDHSNDYCRSWQHLYFEPRVTQFIRIVGTNNTVNKVFHVVAMEALYASHMPELSKGYIVPKHNVATMELSATVMEGVSRLRNALLNGNTQHYDWDSGYTCHQLGSGSILVQLGQPYMISSIRLLLWDCDDRSYNYYVETSVNSIKWEVVADRTRVGCRSWQTLLFDPRPVVYIRIVGTHNTANEVFHIVHLECPAKEVPDENTVPTTNRDTESEGKVEDDESVLSFIPPVSDNESVASFAGRRVLSQRGCNDPPDEEDPDEDDEQHPDFRTDA